MKKRILSILLAVIMVVAMMPITAFAGTADVAQIGDNKYETFAEAVVAATEKQIIEIIQDCDCKMPGDVSKIAANITIKAAEGVNAVFDCTGSGNICSIPNGCTFENVTMNFGKNGYHGAYHAGTINMNNCTLNGLFNSYSDMNFTGCTFNAPGTAASGIDGVDYSMWLYAGNISFDSCVFNGNGKFFNVYNEGNGAWTVSVENCVAVNTGNPNKAVFNVKETCINGKNLKYDVTLKGTNVAVGDFKAPSNSDSLDILNAFVQVDDKRVGGTANGGEIVIKSANDKDGNAPKVVEVTADDYASPEKLAQAISAAKTLGENLYTTPSAKTYVAQIGDDKYETLAAAVDAAPAGVETTITMIANDTLAQDLVIDKDIVLDLAGKTVECGNYFLKVEGNAVITGDGTINKEETSNTTKLQYPGVTGGTATFRGSVYVAPGASLTIENGTYTTKTSSLLVCNNGTLTMEDGLFKCTSDNPYDTKGLVDVRGDNGVLNLLGGSVECYENYADYEGMYGVTPWDNATLNLGAIGTDGPTIHSYYATVCTNGSTAPAIINIYSGTYISDCDVTSDPDAEYDMNVIQISANERAGTEVNIYGGTFTQTAENAITSHVLEVRWKAEKAIHIYGGDFKSAGSVVHMNSALDESNTSLSISGGYYSNDVSDYVATGYECISTPDTDPKFANYPYMVGKKAADIEVTEITDTEKTKIAEKATEGVDEGNKEVVKEAAADAVKQLTENTEVTKIETNVAEAVKTATSDIIARAAQQANDREHGSGDVFTGGTDVKTTTKIEVKLDTIKVDTQSIVSQTTVEKVNFNTVLYDVQPIADVTTVITDGQGNKTTKTERVILTDEDLNGQDINVRLAIPATDAKLAKIIHRSATKGEEIFYATVQGVAPNQYVDIKMNHFSEVEIQTLTKTVEEEHIIGHQERSNDSNIGRAIIPITLDELNAITNYVTVVGGDTGKVTKFTVDHAYTYFYNDGEIIYAKDMGYAAFLIIEDDGNGNSISGYGTYRLYNGAENEAKFMFEVSTKTLTSVG